MQATLDAVVIVCASIVTGVAYHYLAFDQIVAVKPFLASGLYVASLFVAVSCARRVYTLPLLRWSGLELAVTWALIFFFLLGVAFVFKSSEQLSRGATLTFFAVGLTALAFSRMIFDRLIVRALAAGVLPGRRVVLVGEGRESSDEALQQTLRTQGCSVKEVVLLTSDGSSVSSDEATPQAGAVLSAAVRARADEIILAIDWSRAELIAEIMAALQRLPVPVRLVPSRETRQFLEGRASSIGPLVAVDLQRAPLSTPERITKRGLDLVLAGSALFFLLPLLGTLALLVRGDSPGPALFRQTRVGANGRHFRIYKFRTMTTLDDGATIVQAQRGDPRVTRIGRFLRRSSLDELPQLINVLKGDMSLVGPRPHARAHDEYYGRVIADYDLRQHVKPGITGWAQVTGHRGETATVASMQGRVERDIWYIRNWSMWLDVKILALTIFSQLDTRDTY